MCARCIGGARRGGWAETNRKQAFFIRASILNACLTYEAWFGATLTRTLAAFFFHGRCILRPHRHTNLPRIRLPTSRRASSSARIRVAERCRPAVRPALLFFTSLFRINISSITFFPRQIASSYEQFFLPFSLLSLRSIFAVLIDPLLVPRLPNPASLPFFYLRLSIKKFNY